MPKKRGNGEGSVYLRADGRWCASVSIDGGKRKSFYARRRVDVARNAGPGPFDGSPARIGP